MSKIFPSEISTTRLVLRRIKKEDADFVFSYSTDPEINRYVAWLPPKTLEDTIQYLSEAEKSWELGEWFEYLIISKTENLPVGVVSLIPNNCSATIGFAVAKKYWGNGFATEAASAIVDLAISNPEIYRVWTVCDSEHQSSAKVLEKIGLKFEGILKRWKVRPNIDPKIPRDSMCYALTK